jgi:hypothetical protein
MIFARSKVITVTIVIVVLDEKEGLPVDVHRVFPNVKRNVAPLPTSASAQMQPP